MIYPHTLMNELHSQLTRANALYYQGFSTGMTDSEFDALLRVLEILEERFPESKQDNSPTSVVGY